MDILKVVNVVETVIGIPAIIAAFIYVGKKLQVLESLEKTTEKIKANLKVIGDYLTRHHARFDPSELQGFSPIQLTPIGERIIKTIGFEEVFDSHKDEFFEFIASEGPKLKYDVEVAAIKSIFTFAGSPFMDFLKVYLYNNPTRSMDNVAPTLGIYVRDKFLAEHPEITQ